MKSLEFWVASYGGGGGGGGGGGARHIRRMVTTQHYDHIPWRTTRTRFDWKFISRGIFVVFSRYFRGIFVVFFVVFSRYFRGIFFFFGIFAWYFHWHHEKLHFTYLSTETLIWLFLLIHHDKKLSTFDNLLSIFPTKVTLIHACVLNISITRKILVLESKGLSLW